MRRRSYRGFTLIELIAVVAIIGVMTSAVLVSWSTGRSEQDVKLAAREFEAALRQAQNFSMTGKIDANNPTRVPCDYRLRYVSSTQYEIAYQYKNNGVCDGTLIASVQVFSLPGGVTFPPSSDWNDGAVFPLPRGEGVGTNVASIPLQKGSATKNVCIPQSGYFSGASC